MSIATLKAYYENRTVKLNGVVTERMENYGQRKIPLASILPASATKNFRINFMNVK